MSVLSNVRLKDGAGNTVLPVTELPIEVTDAECISAFMAKVNAKATSLKMTNSTFVRPAGDGQNSTTAHDLLKLIIGCVKYTDLMNIWSTKSKTLTINNGTKTVSLSTTVTSNSFEDYYTLLGGKTGSLGAPAEALVILGICEGEVLAGAIMGATSGANRFVAMKELFDIAKLALNGQSTSGESLSVAQAGAICKVPLIPSVYDSNELDTLFTQADTTVLNPASVSKVITAITALDYIEDLDEQVQIVQGDMIGGSGSVFDVDDIVTYRDLLYAMMLPSSNQSAQAIARLVGKTIIAKGLKEQLN